MTHAAEAEKLLSDLRDVSGSGEYRLNRTLACGFSAVTSSLLAVADAVQAGASDTGTASGIEDLEETVSLLTEVLDPATVTWPRRWPWRWLRRSRPAAAAVPAAPDLAAVWLVPSGWQQRAAVRPADRVARWDGGEDGPQAGDQVLCRDVWHMAGSVEPDPEQSGWTRACFDDGTSHLAAPGELTVVRRYLPCRSSDDDVFQLRQLLVSGHITAVGGSYSHLDLGTGAGLGDIAARWWAGTWQCPHCDTCNDPSGIRCTTCEQPRPAGTSPAGGAA